MLGWLFLGLLLVLLATLLFLPIRVEIDTRQATYLRLKAGVLVKVWATAYEDGWFVGFQLPFFKRQIDLFHWPENNNRKPVKKASGGKPIRTGVMKHFPSPGKLLKAVRIDFLEWQLDTGDPCRNAQLYPLFYVLSREPFSLSVNFNNENSLRLSAYTRPYNLLIAFTNRR